MDRIVRVYTDDHLVFNMIRVDRCRCLGIYQKWLYNKLDVKAFQKLSIFEKELICLVMFIIRREVKVDPEK